MQSNVDLCPRCSRSNSYRPPPSPFSGYLFPELRYISLVLISRTNITFFHYIQREFPIRLPAGYFRLWTRDREIPRREITCRKSAVFTWNVCKVFIADNREGISEESLLATVALFLRNVSYSDIAPRVENRIVK